MDQTNIPTSRLLELSQTNVTRDPLQGLSYAERAYKQAATQIEQGVAARQAGFRAEQALHAPAVAEEWLTRSRDALSAEDETTRRELSATELLTGRVFALRLARLGSAAINAAELKGNAESAFRKAEAILESQHQPGQRWDRYGTMLSRHWATHNAINGKAGFAVNTAIIGIWRAINAQYEGTPEAHRTFVARQLGMNALVGLLALSKPLSTIPQVQKARQGLALKLLG